MICPRCGGFVKSATDKYGPYRECIMCGWMDNVGAPPLVAAVARASYAGPEKPGPRRGEGKPKPLTVYSWTWRGSVKRGGRSRKTWNVEITLFYVVKVSKPSRKRYASIVDISGWPFDRWSGGDGRPFARFSAAFQAENGMGFRGLEGVLRELEKQYIASLIRA